MGFTIYHLREKNEYDIIVLPEYYTYKEMKCNSLVIVPFLLTKQITPKRCFIIIFISFFYFLPNKFLGLRFWIKLFICNIKDEFKSFKLNIEVQDCYKLNPIGYSLSSFKSNLVVSKSH